ncbi:MAG: CooT family nickel-binding protein [Methermicoccaceae archaeon]
MCELSVYLERDGASELVAENIVRIVVNRDGVELYGIMGDVHSSKGRLVEVDITKESAYLKA